VVGTVGYLYIRWKVGYWFVYLLYLEWSFSHCVLFRTWSTLHLFSNVILIPTSVVTNWSSARFSVRCFGFKSIAHFVYLYVVNCQCGRGGRFRIWCLLQGVVWLMLVQQWENNSSKFNLLLLYVFAFSAQIFLSFHLFSF
jgi:hypothetical protein